MTGPPAALTAKLWRKLTVYPMLFPGKGSWARTEPVPQAGPVLGPGHGRGRDKGHDRAVMGLWQEL